MTSEIDNPPAFPATDGHSFYAEGMTLRDWFAGQCIVGFEPMSPECARELAKSAYWMAEAMLAARKEGIE